ncbi:zinc-finger domain-containing protein [Sandarakinorhabdus sp.]|uniref:zinc-finger domain-containing protein n=1 Tax=Sandarakinorhabdus sp. TaxID=1916663 RepID=UPI00286EAC92|nr:zinc-finger domain-containing protein [Sandarakinorhabdus sp.]
MNSMPPPETFVSQTSRLFCDGDERGGDGHPRVWIEIGAQGFADCGYCDRRFILASGAADKR